MVTTKKIQALQHKILAWYTTNKRNFPWRMSRDPYKILVSEIMLQQTQVQRVIPRYEAWFKTFPDVSVLAHASTTDVLRLWSGLGYNRRALYLQKCAHAVVKEYNGQFPQDEEYLRKLPGIGEYTARALLCFAFDQQVAVVDTNVRKVIAITFFNGKPPSQKIVQDIAEKLLPKGKAYEWNQALMDYAATVLKAHKVPVAKQSKFLGSHRYYRGQIIKILLAKQIVSVQDLQETLVLDTTLLQTILQGLIKDEFLIQKKDIITLK